MAVCLQMCICKAAFWVNGGGTERGGRRSEGDLPIVRAPRFRPELRSLGGDGRVGASGVCRGRRGSPTSRSCLSAAAAVLRTDSAL